MEKKLYVTILAGGLGKRMKSTIPKVLHKLNGEPMLVRIIKEVRKIKPEKIVVVVGQYYKIIYDTLLKYIDLNDIKFAFQEIPLGTGDAVKSSLSNIEDNSNNLILNGDTPLLTADTLRLIYENFINKKTKLQITCIKLDDPTGNGRIVINNSGIFKKIVEQKDCDEYEKNIKLVNCGIYLANTNILKKYIPKINNNNAQKEYYLTDLVEIYKNEENDQVGLIELPPEKITEIANVNTKEQLEELNSKFN